MDKLSDNVKVQFILGAYKILYGTKYQVDMKAEANIKSDLSIDDRRRKNEDYIRELVEGG